MAGVSGRSILITGGSGFIGSHVTRKLAEQGAEILNVIPNGVPDSNVAGIEGVRTLRADIADMEQLAGVFGSPDIVLHLAAILRSSGEGVKDMLRTNVMGTYNVLSCAAQSNVTGFVNMSTADVYADSKEPLMEDSRLEPVSVYGSSKISSEMLCSNFHRAHGLNAVNIRAFLAYGSRQAPDFLIPSAVRAALANGGFQATGGMQKRDPIFIEDVVSALASVIGDIKNVSGETFNVCTGKGYTVREIVERIFRIAGATSKPDFGALPYRKPEVWNLVGNRQKLTEATGWEPEFSLDRGMEKTVEWYRLSAQGP